MDLDTSSLIRRDAYGMSRSSLDYIWKEAWAPAQLWSILVVIHDRYPRLVAYSRWTVSTDSRCVSRIVDAVSECAVVRCLLRGEQNQPLIDDHDDEGILEEIREGLS